MTGVVVMVVGWWVMVVGVVVGDVGVVMVVGDRGLCWMVNFRQNLNFEFGGHLRTI